MRHKTAATALAAACLSLFVVAGCAGMFRAIGMSEQEAVAAEAEVKQQLVAAAGQAGGPVAELVAIGVATAGAIVSGILTRLLIRERKVTAVMIEGVEAAGDGKTKRAISDAANHAGVAPTVHNRVQALTE
jgi:hypothetical protein